MTHFIDYTFLATGSTNPRTMPARLADVVNVLDFTGADPTGVSDSAAAIQAAVRSKHDTANNKALSGTIYFPPGTYKIDSPIYLPPGRGPSFSVTMDIANPGTVNWTSHGLSANDRVVFNVSDASGSAGTLPIGVTAGTNYYVKTVNNSGQFTISATQGGAAIQFTGSTSGTIYGTNYIVMGYNGFQLIGAGPLSTQLTGNVNGFILDTGNPVTSSARQFGFLIEGMTVSNSNTTQRTTGAIRLGGILGGNVRNVQLGGMVGLTTEDRPGESGATTTQMLTIENCYHGGGANTIGFILHGDGCNLKGVDVSGASKGVVVHGTGHSIIGSHFETNTQAIVLGEFGDGAGGTVHSMLLSGIVGEGNGTVIDVVGSLGRVLFQGIYCHGEGPIGIGGVSNQTSAYGIRISDNKLKHSTIDGVFTNGVFTAAGIYLGEQTGNDIRAKNLIQHCQPQIIGGGGTAWALPTAAQCAGGYEWGPGNNTTPGWTFAMLPTTTNRVEGDQYDITDGQKSGGGTATFGDTVAGSGSQKIRVRFDGTNYTRCG